MPLARPLAVLGLSVLSLSPAQAGDAPACADFTWSVARERTAFSDPALPAVVSGSAMPAVADAVTLALAPGSTVTLPVPSDRAAKAGTFSGFLTASITAPGTYQVTLSDAAWLDVSQDGRTTLKPAAHSGKAGCPEVRKSLRFALDAGPVILAITSAPRDHIKIGLVRAE